MIDCAALSFALVLKSGVSHRCVPESFQHIDTALEKALVELLVVPSAPCLCESTCLRRSSPGPRAPRASQETVSEFRRSKFLKASAARRARDMVGGEVEVV